MMRKMHYNEGLNIKLARQLIANELEEEEDEDEEMKDDTEAEDITVDPPQEGKFSYMQINDIFICFHKSGVLCSVHNIFNY